MVFPRSVWYPSFVDFAALLKVQWFFPPASSLVKYYHLHSVKFGKTTEGINDSHWIKQQLRKRKHSSLWKLDHMAPRYLSDREMFLNPSLPGTLQTSFSGFCITASLTSQLLWCNFRMLFLMSFRVHRICWYHPQHRGWLLTTGACLPLCMTVFLPADCV